MKTLSDNIKHVAIKNDIISNSSNIWESIFDSITDMITIHDNDFHIIYANRAAKKTLLLPLSTTTPIKCFQYYHGTDCPPDGCPSCDCMKTGTPVNFEMFEPHLNKHIEIRALPRYDNRNQVIGIIHIVRDITKRVISQNKLRDSRRQLHKLNAHLFSSIERERESIAREIHDELGQALMVMHMDLALLKKKLSESDRSCQKITRSMSKLLNKTIETVQNITSSLRPKLLDELGLEAAMRWHARKFQKKSGIICSCKICIAHITLDHNSNTNIFRIFQEILTNVYRHAEATYVDICVNENNGDLIMKVKDNGKGITKTQIRDHKSLGLTGMRERVHLLKGNIEIYGESNKGTNVSVRIPLDELRNNKSPGVFTNMKTYERGAK